MDKKSYRRGPSNRLPAPVRHSEFGTGLTSNILAVILSVQAADCESYPPNR
jgi:hypothetical protein